MGEFHSLPLIRESQTRSGRFTHDKHFSTLPEIERFLGFLPVAWSQWRLIYPDFYFPSQRNHKLLLSLSLSCSLFYDTSSVLSMAVRFMSAELEIICNKWSWSNRSTALTFSGGTNKRTMQNLRIAGVLAEIQISRLANS